MPERHLAKTRLAYRELTPARRPITVVDVGWQGPVCRMVIFALALWLVAVFGRWIG